MSKRSPVEPGRWPRWRLSLFEKVILTNSLLLVGEALAGLWITSHALEAHHFLIDTSFLILATLLSLSINALLLRASFRPLFSLLRTIRAVSAGATDARARDLPAHSEVGELARAFNGMLDRLEELRREQARLILQAKEEELRRIALELHDESGQNLTALLVYAEILSQSLQSLPEEAITPEARQQLGAGYRQLTNLAQRTLDSIRQVSQQLRPSVLDDLGLLAALRWFVEESQRRLPLQIDLALEEAPQLQQVPPLYATTLFRIAQECLTNIARHAHAQRACLALAVQEEQIVLRVSDDGCGYDSTQRPAGLGVFGMRERAELLGGALLINSQPGRGTTVEARLPLPEEPKTP